MSKVSKVNQKNELTAAEAVEKINELARIMRQLGQSEADIERARRKALSDATEPARKAVQSALLKAANTIVGTVEFRENLPFLHGSRLSVDIMIDKGGNVSVSERTVIKRSGGSSAQRGGTRPWKVLIHPETGEEVKVKTWSELCASFGVDQGKASAKAKWKSMHRNDPEAYPWPEIVEDDTDPEAA